MPSPFGMSFSVTMKEWLHRPEVRWHSGLLAAGQAFIDAMQKYPATAKSQYRRSGALGNKSHFDITAYGKEISLISVFYAIFALMGTGIFGPKGTPIRPVKAKFLAWRSTGAKSGTLKIASGIGFSKGRMRARSSKDVYLTFARQSSGYKWDGKIEEIRENAKRAFRLAVQRFTG